MFTKFSIRLQALVLGAFMGVVSLSSVAADSTPDELAQMRKKLEDSIQMMQALAARVRELEASQAHTAGQAPSVPPAKSASTVQGPTATVDAARLDAVEQKVTEMETANATHRSDDTGLPMHGFADLGIGTHNPYNRDEKGTFLNNLDFYLIAPRGGSAP